MTVAFVVSVAILIGLLLFLIREVRRPVQASKWDSGPLWQKRLRIAIILILLLVGGVVGWGFLVEPNRLVVRQETLELARWPNAFSGLRIAVLSDLHIGSAFIDDRKVHLIVQRTNELQPDLIV